MIYAQTILFENHHSGRKTKKQTKMNHQTLKIHHFDTTKH